MFPTFSPLPWLFQLQIVGSLRELEATGRMFPAQWEDSRQDLMQEVAAHLGRNPPVRPVAFGKVSLALWGLVHLCSVQLAEIFHPVQEGPGMS